MGEPPHPRPSPSPIRTCSGLRAPGPGGGSCAQASRYVLLRLYQLPPYFSGQDPGWLHALQSTSSAAGPRNSATSAPALSHQVNPRQSSSYACPLRLDMEDSHWAQGTGLILLWPPRVRETWAGQPSSQHQVPAHPHWEVPAPQYAVSLH